MSSEAEAIRESMPSAITKGIEEIPVTAHPSHLRHLALQTLRDLQFAHSWTNLQTHTYAPHDSTRLLPRPIISGLPPKAVYEHPDAQLARLKRAKKEPGSEEAAIVPEWVLPTHLKEKWSLEKMAAVFDNVRADPPCEGISTPDKHIANGQNGDSSRQKRIMLAVISDDSTIVYYIVHDGIVKPRQN